MFINKQITIIEPKQKEIVIKSAENKIIKTALIKLLDNDIFGIGDILYLRKTLLQQ
jgi:hypothetical protein